MGLPYDKINSCSFYAIFLNNFERFVLNRMNFGWLCKGLTPGNGGSVEAFQVLQAVIAPGENPTDRVRPAQVGRAEPQTRNIRFFKVYVLLGQNAQKAIG